MFNNILCLYIHGYTYTPGHAQPLHLAHVFTRANTRTTLAPCTCVHTCKYTHTTFLRCLVYTYIHACVPCIHTYTYTHTVTHGYTHIQASTLSGMRFICEMPCRCSTRTPFSFFECLRQPHTYSHAHAYIAPCTYL